MLVFVAFLVGSISLAFILENPKRRAEEKSNDLYGGLGAETAPYGGLGAETAPSPVSTRLIHSLARSGTHANTPSGEAEPERREARS